MPELRVKPIFPEDLSLEIVKSLVFIEKDFFDIFFSDVSPSFDFLKKLMLSDKTDHTPLFGIFERSYLASYLSAFPSSELPQRRLFFATSLFRYFCRTPEQRDRFKHFSFKSLGQVDSKSFYLSKLVIPAAHQGRGLGKLNLEVLSEHAMKNNFDTLTLHVSNENVNAINFYIKSGFNFSSKLEKYSIMEVNLK